MSQPLSSTPNPPKRRRRRVAQRRLIDLLIAQLADECRAPNSSNGSSLDIIDLGGGTGGVAASLARAGHTVLVVDPSPDALAATQRRAAEDGLADRLTGLQGDTTTLLDIIDEPVQVVLCHLVLERRSECPAALRTIAEALRPGGLISFIFVQPYARVLKHALNGNLAAASEVLTDEDLLDAAALREDLAAAGFEVVAENGIGVLADQVPEEVTEGQYAEMLALEHAADREDWRGVATRLHVLARLK